MVHSKLILSQRIEKLLTIPIDLNFANRYPIPSWPENFVNRKRSQFALTLSIALVTKMESNDSRTNSVFSSTTVHRFAGPGGTRSVGRYQLHPSYGFGIKGNRNNRVRDAIIADRRCGLSSASVLYAIAVYVGEGIPERRVGLIGTEWVCCIEDDIGSPRERLRVPNRGRYKTAT